MRSVKMDEDFKEVEESDDDLDIEDLDLDEEY